MTDSLFAKIIFDTPAKEDAFAGKGHARTAKGLSEGIAQVFDNGGGAIGLEGPYGSGKSTVIGFAEDQLRDSSAKSKRQTQYHVFTFDLWMHQTDEFRRAFLEAFLDFAGEAKFQHLLNIEDERDKIRNRKKVVVTENKHRYTPNGLILIFALPWLPLFYAWLNPTAFVNNATLKNAGFVALVILVAMLLIGGRLIWDNYKRIDAEVRKRDKKFSDKLVRAASEFLTISKKVKDEESTQWIRDEDPTTVEFQETFNRILSKVQTNTNRIVFVLDNIDRLPEDAVKNAWSEMRALFTGRVKGAEPVVLVVPYDQRIVLDAFGHEDTEEAAESDIFTKTFNRILKVSPPVGSHWGAYLDKALQEAFEAQLDDRARYKITRLLQYEFRSKLQHATPRKLVGFVNELGSYWTQWGEIIPIESIAFFVLFRRKIERDAGALLEADLVENGHSQIVDQEELLAHLASLHFNVEPKYAVEVLLGDRVLNALVAETPDDLLRLKEIDGFGQFFQDYLSESLEKATQSQAANIARAGQNIAALDLTGPIADEVASVLAGSIHRMEAVDYSEAVREGLYTIIEIQPASRRGAVAKALRNRLAADFSPETANGFEEGETWGRVVTELYDLVLQLDCEAVADEIWEMTLPNADPDFAIGVAYICEGRQKPRFWDISKQVQMQQLVDALPPYIENEPVVFRNVVAEIDHHLTQPQRLTLLTAISTALTSEERDDESLRMMIDSYWVVDGHFPSIAKQPAFVLLQTIVNDGTLVFYANKAQENEDWQTSAKALFLLTKAQGTTVTTLPATHSVLSSLADSSEWYSKVIAGEIGDEILDPLASFVTYSNRLGLWLSWLKRDGVGSLAEKLVSRAIDTGQMGNVRISALRDNYLAAKTVLGAEKLQALVEAEDGIKFIADIEDIDVLKLPLYLVEALQSGRPNKTLVAELDRIDAKLRSSSQDDWITALNSTDHSVSLLVTRVASTDLTLPPSSFLTPFKDIVLSTLKGELTVAIPDSDLLLQALPKASRKTVANQVVAEMQTVTTEGSAAFVVNFPTLASLLPFDSAPENSIDKLLRELIPSESEAVREHIRKAKRGYTAAFAKASENTRASLVEVIDGLEGDTNETHAWSQEVRTMLGIKNATIAPSKPEDGKE